MDSSLPSPATDCIRICRKSLPCDLLWLSASSFAFIIPKYSQIQRLFKKTLCICTLIKRSHLEQEWCCIWVALLPINALHYKLFWLVGSLTWHLCVCVVRLSVHTSPGHYSLRLDKSWWGSVLLYCLNANWILLTVRKIIKAKSEKLSHPHVILFAALPVAQCWPNINCVCFVKHIQISSTQAYGT